jgi:hypothetical protein
MLLLLHVEVQSLPEAHFAERMFDYFITLRKQFKNTRIINQLAIYLDENQSFRPNTFEIQRHITNTSHHFKAIKLIDWEGRLNYDNVLDFIYRDKAPNFFYIVILAQLESIRHKTIEAKYVANKKLYLLIAEIKEAHKDFYLAMLHFIAFVIKLPNIEIKKLKQEVKMSEPVLKNKTVYTILDAEREEGREEGKFEAYFAFIKAGQSPEVAARILKITPEMLEKFQADQKKE